MTFFRYFLLSLSKDKGCCQSLMCGSWSLASVKTAMLGLESVQFLDLPFAVLCIVVVSASLFCSLVHFECHYVLLFVFMFY